MYKVIADLNKKFENMMEHNFSIQKRDEKNIKVIKNLIELLDKYPNAQVLQHYVKKDKIYEDSFFSVLEYELSELLPVYSVVGNDDFIILSNTKDIDNNKLIENKIGNAKELLSKINKYKNDIFISEYSFLNSHMFLKVKKEDDIYNFKEVNSFRNVSNLITWSGYLFE